MEHKQSYVAELAGALVLVFVGGAAIATNLGNPLVAAAALGATFAGMWWLFGHRGHVHLNPALTVADAAARRGQAKDALPTIAAQVLGALFAGGLLFAVFDGRPFGGGAVTLSATAPGLAGWSVLSVVVLEALATAAFALVWLRVTERGEPEPATAIALGAAYGGIALASMSLTASALNPLRTVPAAVFAQASLGTVAVFWVASLVGALIAAGVWTALVAPGRAPARAPRAAQA